MNLPFYIIGFVAIGLMDVLFIHVCLSFFKKNDEICFSEFYN